MAFETTGRYENIRSETYIFFKFDGDVGRWMGENRVIIFFILILLRTYSNHVKRIEQLAIL